MRVIGENMRACGVNENLVRNMEGCYQEVIRTCDRNVEINVKKEKEMEQKKLKTLYLLVKS